MTQHNEGGSPNMARGKVCWFNEQEIGRDCNKCLPLFRQMNPTHMELSALKDELKKALEKKGFVFFEECYYRYKLNKNGTLKEFGVNFHHIR